jgi:hypothetical protein
VAILSNTLLAAHRNRDLDWIKIYTEIEDLLIPHYQFDIWERGLYLYLLNQTRLRGLESATIPLSTISAALSCSDWQSRKTIRVLGDKGVIELEQTRKGHAVKVLLPTELGIQPVAEQEKKRDIEDIDFFKNREFVSELIAREKGQCFYCLSDISLENCELDHVVSQLNGGNNSYKNIVASCHKCNTRKLATEAEDYLRSIFRKGMLSDSELEGRLSATEALKSGNLKPQI